MAGAQERVGVLSEHEKLDARLRAARDYVGLSQDLIAHHLGVSRPAISAMERGTRKVSSVELKKLARLYGKPVAFFLGEETDPVLEADEVSNIAVALWRPEEDKPLRQVIVHVHVTGKPTGDTAGAGAKSTGATRPRG